MEKFNVIQIDEDIPMGVAFSGTREECERFVELQRELRSMNGNPIEVDFEIEEG